MRSPFIIALALAFICAAVPAMGRAQTAEAPTSFPAADTSTVVKQANVSSAAPAVPTKGAQSVSVGGKTWFLILSPIVGGLRNTINFRYDVPTGKDETTPREKSLTDTGWGLGLTTVLVWKQLAVTNVIFDIPSVNSSNVFGNVLTAHYSWPVHPIFEPAFSLGLVYNRVAAGFVNFEDTVTKEGVSATAHFDHFYVNNDIFTVVPKAGIKVRIPIQHWYIKPFVGYMGEWVLVDVHTPGGSVYIPAPINSYKEIPAISSKKTLDYHSLLLGSELFLDFHYALQLRTLFYYNLSYDTFNLRMIASAFFSRKVPLGLTTYFEWSRGISHDNLYLFAGPAWMF